MARAFEVSGRDIVRTLRQVEREKKQCSMVWELLKRIRRTIMSEERGIQETKEALKALCLIGAFTLERLHDGAQLSDAFALGKKLLDEDFRKTIIDGAEKVDQIPAELKDISPEEMSELLNYVKTDCLHQMLLSLARVQAARPKEEGAG